MNKKVYIIGNRGKEKVVTDGGRIKVRLYENLLKKINVPVEIIELDGWKKNIFKVLNQIKNAVKEESTILIMAGPKGCRVIIPLVNKINKKGKSRVVFCALGIGTLDKVAKKLSIEELNSFLGSENNFGISDNKMAKNLKKLDLIIIENEVLVNKYRTFYKLDNVEMLTNFRDTQIIPKEQFSKGSQLKIVFTSRVCENKGIFDLIEVVNDINKENCDLFLDIYGALQLNVDENILFEKSLNKNVNYRGEIQQHELFEKIKEYDLFVLPTKYYGEGTSGSLIEALIAGVPALVSSYSQAKTLINDNENGFIFKINDKESLKERLLEILDNKERLPIISRNAQITANKYVFENNKEKFEKFILGDC